MTIVLAWLLLGATGTNLLMIKRVQRGEAQYNGKLYTYYKGLGLGLLLGPLSVLLSLILKGKK